MPATLQDPASLPTRLLEGLAAEPALLELILVFAGLGCVLLIAGRASRLVRDARSKAAIDDYLLGVEQALAGDATGACKRLARVLAEDPDNHVARLLHGEALFDVGRTADAHREHVHLQRAFQVDSARNVLGLARCLASVPGREAEAAEAARKARAGLGRNLEAHRLLFTTELKTGQVEAAADTARQLASLLAPGEERDAIRARAAEALASAGAARLAAGGAESASKLLAAAQELAPEVPAVALLEARLVFATQGPAGLTRLLPPAREAAPGTSGTALVTAGLRTELALLARLAPTVSSPRLCAELDAPGEVLDAIELSRAHVRRTLERAAGGAAEAEAELVAMRAEAVEELMAAALRPGPLEAIAARCLARMGPAILPEVFVAHGRLKQRDPFGLVSLFAGGNTTQALSRIVQGFGRDALPHFDSLLDTEDRELRKVLIDYFLGLADPAEFQRVLDRFPPIEILHRLNQAPAEVLQRFLAHLQEATPLAEVLLVDPAFHRDLELVVALTLSPQNPAIPALLIRRGYDGDLAEAQLDHLAHPVLAAAVGRVLDSYGERAIDHFVAGFADLDRASEVRAELERRLLRFGPAIVARVCACFGPSPSAIDAELQRLLVQLGAPAAEPLAAAYAETGWLEKLGGPLVRRHTHRRVAIVRVLALLPGDTATRLLRELLARETDPNLQLRLQEALHRRRT